MFRSVLRSPEFDEHRNQLRIFRCISYFAFHRQQKEQIVKDFDDNFSRLEGRRSFDSSYILPATYSFLINRTSLAREC